MVMEYVQGKTLNDLIPKGGLRVPLLIKYALQMADAGPPPARLAVEERHQLVDAANANFGAAEATHREAARRRVRGLGEIDLIATPDQQAGRPLRPFDDRRAALAGSVSPIPASFDTT